MLNTPAGRVFVWADGEPIEFTAEPHSYNVPSEIGTKLAGCYRININTAGYSSVRCALVPVGADIEWTYSTGECYMESTIISGTEAVTIGTMDEYPAFTPNQIPYGIECHINRSDYTLTFGIAWVTDYNGDSDVRTWLGADPTLSSK